MVTKNPMDFRSRIDMIRRPEVNHMSRTRSRTDKFRQKKSDDGKGGSLRRKKRLYDGAFVAEVRRQVDSGARVAGALLKHLHNFVIDFDLTSLYPSIMLLVNLSPKTFVAKLLFAEKLQIPMYEYIQFLDKEEKHDYKCNPNDFAIECVIGLHWWALMEIFCNMKTTEQIFDHIDSHLKDFT